MEIKKMLRIKIFTAMVIVCAPSAFCQNNRIETSVQRKIVDSIQCASNLETLIPYLNDKRREVRELAIKRWDSFSFNIQNIEKQFNLTKKLIYSKYHEVKQAARSRYFALARLRGIGKEARKVVFDIENTRNLDELRPYLLSTSEIVRYFAIWKLQRSTPNARCESILKNLIQSDNWRVSSIAMAKYCEIGNSEAIEKISALLKQKKISRQAKMELIRGISKNLDEQNAYQILTDYIDYKIKQGPNSSLIDAHSDREYIETLRLSLNEISSFKLTEVDKFLLKTFQNMKAYWGIRQNAYEYYMRRKFQKLQMTEKSKVKYILKNLTAPVIGRKEYWGKNGPTNESIKNFVIGNILRKHLKVARSILELKRKSLPPGSLRRLAIEEIVDPPWKKKK